MPFKSGRYREGFYVYLQVDVFSLPATNNSFNISQINTPFGGRSGNARAGQNSKTTFERGVKGYFSAQRKYRGVAS
jgi:hypothetical protein